MNNLIVALVFTASAIVAAYVYAVAFNAVLVQPVADALKP